MCKSNDLVAYENLQVRNLLKNHCLAKSISDVSWSLFRHWLEYFAGKFGRLVVAVPPQRSQKEEGRRKKDDSLPSGDRREQGFESPAESKIQQHLFGGGFRPPPNSSFFLLPPSFGFKAFLITSILAQPQILTLSVCLFKLCLVNKIRSLDDLLLFYT